jgi:uncharacterized protein
MKFLLLFLIGMVLVWQWRQARLPKVKQAQRKSSPASVVEMVACAHCGLHLPAADTVKGARGFYCSAAHRQAQEH